jgi:hypothetical protein
MGRSVRLHAERLHVHNLERWKLVFTESEFDPLAQELVDDGAADYTLSPEMLSDPGDLVCLNNPGRRFKRRRSFSPFQDVRDGSDRGQVVVSEALRFLQQKKVELDEQRILETRR